MSVIVTWDNRNRNALRYIHYGNWTWNQLDDALEESHQKLRRVHETVHVIIDLRESGALPRLPVMREKGTLSLGQSKDGLLILVGVNSLTWPYFDVLKRLYRNRRNREHVHFVDTLEEARALAMGVVPVS